MNYVKRIHLVFYYPAESAATAYIISCFSAGILGGTLIALIIGMLLNPLILPL